ncbi:uncharacterized protein [Watersipora subatra]|uniref:uncharacterized protein n=1 Tax=Watersipora subatra TaxID=2589382 RepID=UPI00355BDB6B
MPARVISFKGSWNNNPSVQQFQHIFRRLVTRCGVTPGATGNVISVDDTALLQASTTYVPPTGGSEDYVEDVIDRQTMLPEGMLYITSHPILGNIAVYLSGWLVKKLLKMLHCGPFRLSLIQSKEVSKYDDIHILLRVKNNSGLISPSDGVVTTVLCTEKYLKAATSANQCLKYPKILKCVKEEIVRYDIFELKQHCTDTSVGINNNHFSLLALVVETYFDLRQHHFANLKNLDLHKVNIKHNATKTLFRGLSCYVAVT